MRAALKALSVVFIAALLGVVAGFITWAVLSKQQPVVTTSAAVRNSATPPPPPQQEWWEHCVLYQIYPRSFKDSNADGIGDLQGIISELEHFVEAGVDAIWMSPIFESPMIDFGYDVSNFYEVHHEYGTMQDFEELLQSAHDLGLKVILDFVPNHASTLSKYFIESEKRNPLYEDHFVWADPLWVDPANETNRQPPSNWVSQFGGSAWEWSEIRKQYYLHQFAIQQADCNYRNDVVKQEMFNILTFWLDKGADGFRLDALPYIMEANPDDHEGRYPDDPLSGLAQFESHQLGYTIPVYTKDLIELYDIVYEWRTFLDEYNDDHNGDTRVIFGEAYANVSMTMLYYGNDEGEIGAHFPFNFDFITDLSAASSAKDFVYIILRWLTYMPQGGVANWVFGNHDNNRMPSRFRHNMVDGLNSLNMLLPGVAVTYQGEEIGMKDGYVSWEDTVDVEACNRGDNETYHLYSRDPARTPFHWDNTTSAGFSTNNVTWLPVADDFMEINLAKQKEDDRSHFKNYQALTALRNETTLAHGDCDVRALSDNIFYVVRSLRSHATFALVFNVGEEADAVDLTRVRYLQLPALVEVASVHSSRSRGSIIDSATLTLKAGEALVLRAEPI